MAEKAIKLIKIKLIKNKQWQTNAKMLGLTLVLAFIYWITTPIPNPIKQLHTVSPATINEIEIISKKQGRLKLKKENLHWLLVDPVMIKANQVKVNGLFRILLAKSHAKYLTQQNLKQYGLELPKIKVTFNQKHTVAFGGKTAIDNQRYVLVNQQIHTISPFLFYLAKGGYPAFVDNKLFEQKITRLKFADFEVNAEPKWNIEKNDQILNVPATKIKQFVKNWQNLTAIRVKKYQQSIKTKSIVIQFKNAPSITFDLLSNKNELILARPDLKIQYLFSISLKNILFRLP